SCATLPTKLHTRSLHDALPILPWTPESATLAHRPSRLTTHPAHARHAPRPGRHGVPPPRRSAPAPWVPRSRVPTAARAATAGARSEEHTSELQSRFDLVCRLLL